MSESNGSRQAVSLLFVHAQTPLHPGSGTALGVVDLPVQRERHTQWPLIPGTSLKGVLRDAARRDGDEEAIADAFGPDKNADKHAGAIAFTDARLLAFPVRSLRGVFAWVTCPSVLDRFNRDVALANVQGVAIPSRPLDHQALCPKGSPVCLDGNSLVLEEFEFAVAGDGTELADQLARLALPASDHATAESMRERLVVLSDNDFTHFARHATEVVARIGLNPQTKTVSPRALFYQEFLPTETMFYSVVIANASRSGRGHSASQMLSYLRRITPRILQVGGDETTGKGLCALHYANSKE
jgi:CRISPR-associated protein Cmr4